MTKKPAAVPENRKRAYPAALPEMGFLRLRQIIGDPDTNPPTPALIPIGKSTWWEGVRSGRFPAAVRLGPKTTVWTISSIRAFLDQKAA